MSEQRDMEERLRAAFRAVAEQPSPVTSAVPVANGRRHRAGSRRRPPRLLLAVVSVAALALVIALALTFGPHSSAPPGSHDQSPAPSSHPTPTTTPTPTPTTTTPTPTTTTTNPTPSLGLGLSGTEQITYQPFTGATLNPDLQVTGQQSGTCFQYGGGAEGRYFYRCGTVQPCVAGSDGTAAPLACPVASNPTTNEVLLWTATSINTTGFTPATAKTPFAMQLSNGVVCALVDAAWSGLGPFGCGGNDGTAAGAAGAASTPADCRPPQFGTPVWTADCQDQLTQSSPFTSTTVLKVWF